MSSCRATNGKVWWASWTQDGVTKRRSTRCSTRSAAEVVVARWEREFADPIYAAAQSAEYKAQAQLKADQPRGLAESLEATLGRPLSESTKEGINALSAKAQEALSEASLQWGPKAFEEDWTNTPEFVQAAHRDPMRLADECGRLADENRELKIENCELRRKLERLERGRR